MFSRYQSYRADFYRFTFIAKSTKAWLARNLCMLAPRIVLYRHSSSAPLLRIVNGMLSNSEQQSGYLYGTVVVWQFSCCRITSSCRVVLHVRVSICETQVYSSYSRSTKCCRSYILDQFIRTASNAVPVQVTSALRINKCSTRVYRMGTILQKSQIFNSISASLIYNLCNHVDSHLILVFH